MDKLKLFCDFIKNHELYNLVISGYHDDYHDDYDIDYDVEHIKNSTIYTNIRLFIEDRINNGKICEFDFSMFLGSYRNGHEYDGYENCDTQTIEYWSKSGIDIFKYIDTMQVIISIDEDNYGTREYFEIDHELREDISLTLNVRNIEENKQKQILEALRKTLAEFGISQSSYKR